MNSADHPVTSSVSCSGPPVHQQLWQRFQTLVGSLCAEPTPRQVMVNITHGWRIQPFFEAAEISYVRGLDSDAPPMRVLYGAHQKGEPTVGVWDIWASVDLANTPRFQGLDYPSVRP